MQDLQKAEELVAEVDQAAKALERQGPEQAMGIAVIFLDPEGHVLSWGDAAESLTGFSDEEALGRHVSFLRGHTTKSDILVERELREALRQGRFEELGVRFRHDGSSFWAHALVFPVRASRATCQGYVKVLRDLSGQFTVREPMAEREAFLTETLAEREVLLQEVHHRVKNNLQVVVSLINMQIRACSDPGSRQALQECASRVQAMALIHEKLYQSEDFSRIPFFDYVKSLATGVVRTSGIEPGRVQLRLSVDQIPLRVDRAIPCGLLLNELLSNAMKHGFSRSGEGTVEVTLRRTPEGLELGVENDGDPLPPEFELGSSTTLGMQLVSTLTSQLEGKIRVESEPRTAFWVTFPLEPAP